MDQHPVPDGVVEVDCERVIRGQKRLIEAQRAIIDAVRGQAEHWMTLADGDRYYAERILALLDPKEGS